MIIWNTRCHLRKLIENIILNIYSNKFIPKVSHLPSPINRKLWTNSDVRIELLQHICNALHVRHCISNHRQLDRLLNNLIRLTTYINISLLVPYKEYPIAIGGFPSQRVSDIESVAIWWRPRGFTITIWPVVSSVCVFPSCKEITDVKLHIQFRWMIYFVNCLESYLN